MEDVAYEKPLETQDDAFVGDSAAIVATRQLVARIGPTDLSVLIVGGSGTGKESAARVLHHTSTRAGGPFVTVRCSTPHEDGLEAQLFGLEMSDAFANGHEDAGPGGQIAASAGGTLFLADIGDMPMGVQADLLRVLHERDVPHIGPRTHVPLDFRLMASTTRNLDADVQAGRFKSELLFRLREVALELPALAERREDIVPLATSFMRKCEDLLSVPHHMLSPEAEQVLKAHAWPGNFQELRAAIRRAVVLSNGSVIEPADLRLSTAPGAATPVRRSSPPAELGDLGRSLCDARDDYLGRYVVAVLAEHGGDRRAAARSLRVSLRSLYRYLHRAEQDQEDGSPVPSGTMPRLSH